MHVLRMLRRLGHRIGSSIWFIPFVTIPLELIAAELHDVQAAVGDELDGRGRHLAHAPLGRFAGELQVLLRHSYHQKS